MCGRFTLTTPLNVLADVLTDLLQLEELPGIIPRYNIAPTQPVPVIRASSTSNRRQFVQLRWGLIPSWAKDQTIGSRLINARAETITEKPSFKSAMRSRRCLILADGFYEWQKNPGTSRKQPHYIHMKDGSVFAFAGLWESWTGNDQKVDGQAVIETCTIITTEPNALMKPLHNRMPAILERSNYNAWLDPDNQDAQSVTRLLGPYDTTKMSAYPVNNTVNSPSNDVAACIDRAFLI